jgi:hypothetical protein
MAQCVRTTLIVALLLLIGVEHGSAQSSPRLRIGGWGTFLTSSQPTLRDGAGGGLGVSMDVAGREWLGFSLAIAQTRTDSERDGLACRSMVPFPGGCEPDHLTETATVRSLSLAVQPRAALTRQVSVAGQLGVSVNELIAVSKGTATSLTGNLYAPESAHTGSFLDLGLVWSPFAYFPLDLVVGATNHWIFFDGCRSHPSVFAPYCGAASLFIWRAGLSFGIDL